jgi:hypothetical protein
MDATSTAGPPNGRPAGPRHSSADGAGPDWAALDARHVPAQLRGRGGGAPEDRRAALRLLASPAGGVVPGAGGFGERLDAVLAWARLDVPLAVLAAGHAHALDLMDHPSPPYLRPDAIWAVWLPDGEPSALTAEPGGPVYRLTGVVGRPVGGGTVTHVVVAATGSEGRLLLAVDLSHPRVVVMSTLSSRSGCLLEFPGIYRFEGVPATPLSRPAPPHDVMRRLLGLSGSALVVGAAAGLTATAHEAAARMTPVVDELADEVRALARIVDAAGAGGRGAGPEVSDLAARVRVVAADLLTLVADAEGDPVVAGRAAQLELAMRLGSRTY